MIGVQSSSSVSTGRGTARSAVEGAWERSHFFAVGVPSTTLRVVPLPRFAGKDG